MYISKMIKKKIKKMTLKVEIIVYCKNMQR